MSNTAPQHLSAEVFVRRCTRMDQARALEVIKLYRDGEDGESFGPKIIARRLGLTASAVQRILSRARRAGVRLPLMRRGAPPNSYIEESVIVYGTVGKCRTTVYSADGERAAAHLARLQEVRT